MGRLPSEFNGRKILGRIPYTMPGELQIASNTLNNQYPELTFQHNIAMAYEIHRVSITISALDAAGLMYIAAVPPSFFLDQLTRIRIEDVMRNQVLTKNPQLVATLLRADTRTWEWADPYIVEASQGFRVSMDNLATPGIVGGAYISSRAAVSFQGNLLIQ
jgi:hypothetical protein